MWPDGSPDPGPFFYQPDPKRPLYVPAKAEKVVQRGAGEYYIVGRMPDGREVEARLTAGTFRMHL
jgi:hypothetical protein